jgi:hypothetical protein
MANHVAIQIRDRIAQLVAGLATTGSNVFKAVAYPLARNALPGLIVRLGDESLDALELLGPRQYDRRCVVEVVAYTEGDDLDGARMQIAKEVEIALATTTQTLEPWKGLTLRALLPATDASSENPIGELIIRYEAEYFTEENAPDVSV